MSKSSPLNSSDPLDSLIESGSDISSSDESDSNSLSVRILPSRITRGKRLSEVMQEGDEDFWNQAYFQDNPAEDDKDYELSEQEIDYVDSDFLLSEQESDEGREYWII